MCTCLSPCPSAVPAIKNKDIEANLCSKSYLKWSSLYSFHLPYTEFEYPCDYDFTPEILVSC